MISPFTGGKVTLKHEKTTITYRGEAFSCNRYFYICEDTGIEFTDAKLDDKGLSEVHEQYRKEHGIPSANELKLLRESIGISAKTMSLVLGLGENQYRLYEAGEMPSESIGKMLATLSIPGVIESYLETSRNLFSFSNFLNVMAAIQRKRNVVYHVTKYNNMENVCAIPSVIKSSKSRWSDAEESILFNTMGILAPVI